MLYFSYGTDLSAHAVLDFCRAHHRPVPRRGRGRPAVLANYRIQFPRYNSFFGGGVADITAETGKSVGGSIFEISDSSLQTLEQLSGMTRPATIKVSPLAGGPPVEAIAFFDGQSHQPHVPPSPLYMERLIQAAVRTGLSMMWIMQLQTFAGIGSTQRRSPLRPEFNDQMYFRFTQRRKPAPAPARSRLQLVNC